MLAILGGWLLGLLLGARHALEPDHVAAVSSMLADQTVQDRATASRLAGTRGGLLLGAAWGVGHALTILAVGGALLVCGAHLPERLADAFELAVALMLVTLGARALVRAVRKGAHAPHRAHAGWRLTRRPLAAGLVHGLAGSGAVTALVLGQLPGWAEGLVFLLLFGVGAAMGMALLTGAASATLGRFVRRDRTIAVLSGVTGVISVGLGAGWGWPIVHRLLGA
jgi:hypothetical protein